MAVHGRDFQQPLVIEVVGEVGEQVDPLAFPAVPGRAQAGGARQLQVRTIAVARQALPARGGIELLVGGADAEGGGVVEVVVEGAIDHLVVALAHVVEVLAVLPGDHQPATQAAGRVQRAAGVELGAVVVPGACRKADAGSGLFLSALADEVDATGGAAGALEHAGGTAQHFDAVVVGHVAGKTVGLHVVATEVQRHTVVLVLAGKHETARVEVFTAHGRVMHGDPRGFLHHLFEGGEVLLVHHLAGDHRHRLRRLAQ
ncbi:hypothetical protein D3C81_1440950 [compost metagenome]